MVKKKETADGKTNQSLPRRAILFELENLAVKGRQTVYDVLKSVLVDKGIELTPMMFSRYCLHTSVKHFLPRLLASEGKKRLSESKLLAEITQGIRLSFTDNAMKLEPGFAKVLKAAEEQHVFMGGLSSLDEEAARQLAARLGLVDMGIGLLSYSCEDKNFPSADAWLKLTKNMSVRPPLCVVLATSATACKAALSAGMRCVVIPDKFTAFQDFSGVDYVADALSSTTLEYIFSLWEFS